MADSIGGILSARRRALGRSLADAEANTRIRARMLAALEADDYDILPASAYVRGYLISYAKYLELDPEPLLRAYSQTSANAVEPETVLPQEQIVRSRHEAQSIPFRAAALIVAAIALLSLTIWGIGRLVSGPEELAPLPTVPEATSTVEATPTPPPTVEVTLSDEPDPDAVLPPGTPFTLRVEVADGNASWLRVTIDGLKAYEGTLVGASSKEWEVTDTAVIRVGRPSVVSVLRDGTVVEVPLNAETPELTLSATESEQ